MTTNAPGGPYYSARSCEGIDVVYRRPNGEFIAAPPFASAAVAELLNREVSYAAQREGAGGTCYKPDPSDVMKRIDKELYETEVCHCGDWCKDHTQSSGHAPVWMPDPITQLLHDTREEIKSLRRVVANPARPSANAGVAPFILDALKDARSGWLYIRSVHGELSGVGWDRVNKKLDIAIAEASKQPSPREAKLCEALRFYADTDNHFGNKPPVEADGGNIARQALAEYGAEPLPQTCISSCPHCGTRVRHE